ncbi:hypothetical protein CCH79_00000323 [Gambusia affinis]|uniref:Uncharacterized protein n=1 Tax=Gambusia affinis TaxID=33528 RepID=A0A315VVK2_GAMAF|nr:hypothetical protein CCH79_00000323 [Gambusia affinis]
MYVTDAKGVGRCCGDQECSTKHERGNQSTGTAFIQDGTPYLVNDASGIPLWNIPFLYRGALNLQSPKVEFAWIFRLLFSFNCYCRDDDVHRFQYGVRLFLTLQHSFPIWGQFGILPVTTRILFQLGFSPVSVSDSTVKMADLEASVLEESLNLLEKTEMETARSVPEVDLSSTLYPGQDWEPLHTSTSNNDFEPLCTPVVTCTPACTTYTSSFAFTFPEAETFPTCGIAHRRGSNSNDQSSDSLSSPTLLAL